MQAQLICVFVFEFADCWFSDAVAQLILLGIILDPDTHDTATMSTWNSGYTLAIINTSRNVRKNHSACYDQVSLTLNCYTQQKDLKICTRRTKQ